MADVVGIIGVGVQLTETALKLRKVWKSIKDAPKGIIALAEEIGAFSEVLSELQEISLQNTSLPETSSKWKRCRQDCEKLLQKLRGVQEDAENKMAKSKIVGRIVFALRNEVVAGLRSDLERAKSSLTIAQISYLTVLGAQQTLERRENHAVLVALVQQRGMQHIRPVDEPQACGQILLSSTRQNMSVTNSISADDPDMNGVDKLRPRRNTRRRATNVLQFTTPTWWLGRVWSFQMEKACSGWNFKLREYHVHDDSSPVLESIKKGDLSNLQMIFATRAATPFDTTAAGDPLLHMAVVFCQVDICRFLLEQGADVNARSPYGGGVTYFTTSDANMLRLLLDEYGCEDLIWEDPSFFNAGLGYTAATMEFKLQYVFPPYQRLSLSARLFQATRRCNTPEMFWLALGQEYFDEECFKEADPARNLYGYAALSVVAKGMGGIMEAAPSSYFDDSKDWKHILGQLVRVANALEWPQQGVSSIGAFIRSFWWCHPINPSKDISAELTRVLKVWVQEVVNAGADIINFGRFEHDAIMKSVDDNEFNWHTRYWRRLHFRPIALTYGPMIEDWSIWVSWPLDEWSGDFWNLVENPEQSMPGSWIDEGEKREDAVWREDSKGWIEWGKELHDARTQTSNQEIAD